MPSTFAPGWQQAHIIEHDRSRRLRGHRHDALGCAFCWRRSRRLRSSAAAVVNYLFDACASGPTPGGPRGASCRRCRTARRRPASARRANHLHRSDEAHRSLHRRVTARRRIGSSMRSCPCALPKERVLIRLISAACEFVEGGRSSSCIRLAMPCIIRRLSTWITPVSSRATRSECRIASWTRPRARHLCRPRRPRSSIRSSCSIRSTRLAAYTAAVFVLMHFGRVTDVPRLTVLLKHLRCTSSCAWRLSTQAPPTPPPPWKMRCASCGAIWCAPHGCNFTAARFEEILAKDIELNVQGLIAWLERRKKA